MKSDAEGEKPVSVTLFVHRWETDELVEVRQGFPTTVAALDYYRAKYDGTDPTVFPGFFVEERENVERCRGCGQEVTMMVQKGSGSCCQLHNE